MFKVQTEKNEKRTDTSPQTTYIFATWFGGLFIFLAKKYGINDKCLYIKGLCHDVTNINSKNQKTHGFLDSSYNIK